ncbi:MULTISPECIES: DUF3558 domain-containing protein [unclassified Actinopolyspora]|uniref:DUF3558 domain-containing protein n=1 Tax=unclassified Actinopolyspora TaxID=2639451 RepID=UPI001F62182C|nr:MULTISPECIES: DUF3558 domain-containing protein [unclassified Actinopolyspora]
MGSSSGVRRGAAAVSGLVLSVVLAACSGGSGADSGAPSSQSRSADASGSQGSSGVDIANPKEAAAVDVCSLLPEQAASSLGLQNEGEKQSNGLGPSLPDSCEWSTAESIGTSVSLSVVGDRSIQTYFDNKSSYSDFEGFEISGNPAVRANKDDPMTGGSCAVFLATKKNQVVKSFSTIPARDVGKVNPCDLSKKALKLSVSSWPAAE